MGKYQKSYEDSITNEPALNKRAYNIIKNRIIFDKLHPGQQLSIASLAEELQVSRTPISVSLSALERDGYVVVQPQRGTFVRELTPFELEIIFKARASLGKLVKVIADLTMNSRYIAYRNRFGGLTDQQIKVLCCDNHVAIIDALLKSDVSKGADAFVKDVCSGWESIKL